MAVDQTYISTLEPKFSSVSADAASMLITIASLQVGPRWGDLQDYGTALLVLHMWVMNQSKGKGNVTRERIGDIEKTYASKETSKKSSLELTNWGLEYVRIGRSRLAGPILV